MALFTYKAIDTMGRTQSGKLDAVNESDLEQRLTRMGMELIRCKYVQEKVRRRLHDIFAALI